MAKFELRALMGFLWVIKRGFWLRGIGGSLKWWRGYLRWVSNFFFLWAYLNFFISSLTCFNKPCLLRRHQLSATQFQHLKPLWLLWGTCSLRKMVWSSLSVQELTSWRSTVAWLSKHQPICFLLVSTHFMKLIFPDITCKQFLTLMQSLHGFMKIIHQNLQLKSNPSFLRQYVTFLLWPLLHWTLIA